VLLPFGPATHVSWDKPWTCVTALEQKRWPEALRRCSAEHTRAPSPETILHLARARVETDDLEGGEALAAPLVDGPFAADANQLVGLALRDIDAARAETYVERALKLHAERKQFFEAARDAQVLAGLLSERSESARALEQLELATTYAEIGHNAHVLFLAFLGKGIIFSSQGHYAEAEPLLRAALARASDADERSWALLYLGLLYIQRGPHALALEPLREALALATSTQEERIFTSARMNLAWLARDRGDFDEASKLFDSIPASYDPVAVHYNRGLIAAGRAQVAATQSKPAEERHQIERAAAEFEAAERANPRDHWEWAIATELGQLEERLGRPDLAEAAYVRATTAVSKLRDGAGPQLAAHVLASQRRPHEQLIGLFASQRRWRDVLKVVLDFDLSTLLATDAPSTELSVNGEPLLPPGARPVLLPSRWAQTDATSKRPPPSLDDVERVLEAWRGRHLIVIVPGGERIWRLEIEDGEVHGVDVGSPSDLQKLADRLAKDPADADAARGLGATLVPLPGQEAPHAAPAVARRGIAPAARGDATIDLLIIGPLGRTPLAALRHGSALVTASTPLARVLGLRALRAPSLPNGGSIVLGDPRNNLPAASQEASWVAERLGVSAVLGHNADRNAIAASRDAGLLHVAAHAIEGPSGAALRLADGDLSASDVMAMAPTARVVVLASCASAAASDEAGWGSLAAAFVVAGAESVVATQWSVNDAEAAELVEALYEDTNAMRKDPARALAAAQTRLARRATATTWAAFTVVRAPPTL
jgi:tetratricopeptide (TPR) repeat protein